MLGKIKEDYKFINSLTNVKDDVFVVIYARLDTSYYDYDQQYCYLIYSILQGFHDLYIELKEVDLY